MNCSIIMEKFSKKMVFKREIDREQVIQMGGRELSSHSSKYINYDKLIEQIHKDNPELNFSSLVEWKKYARDNRNAYNAKCIMQDAIFRIMIQHLNLDKHPEIITVNENEPFPFIKQNYDKYAHIEPWFNPLSHQYDQVLYKKQEGCEITDQDRNDAIYYLASLLHNLENK